MLSIILLSACSNSYYAKQAEQELGADAGLSQTQINRTNDGAIDLIENQKAPEKMTQSTTRLPKPIEGTIVYQSFEGGFFSFISNDGSKFTLMGLAEHHRKNGLVVSIQGEIVHDVMTTTQFGQILKIIDIVVIDESKVKPVVKNNQDI